MVLYIGDKPVGLYKVVEKKVPKTLFGLGLDQWVGVLDENGMLTRGTEPFEINAVGLKDADAYILSYRFRINPNVVSANFPDLTAVSGDSALSSVFYECSGLTSADLENLTTISGNYGYNKTFYHCDRLTRTGLKNLTTISGQYSCDGTYERCLKLTRTGLENLTTISGRYCCQYMFRYCSGLTSAGFENLTTVSGYGVCFYMFNACTGLTKEYFPMLTTVTEANAFGSSSSNGMFQNCTNLTELHYRKDAQAVIEGLTGYQYKFGATNATIFFDLIGTITVNGVVYARDEKQSIRVDGVKTFVGWKDAGGNVVYTSYANNAEPAVGTVVYSDQGTTQAGIVSGVA